ncbi:MAG: WYL domain-containing protein [Actinobacteria bacterium]|nr:WYL domain-containing protein [Actinomycetota bacterium]
MAGPEARLRRMLALIPYVLKHQGATLQELCEIFGVTREQLIRDLELIFLCGQPDYTPADLIEVSMEDDRVHIGMADYFARPVRFTPLELAGLYLACSAFSRLVGPPATSALQSAMLRIQRAMGMEGLSPEEVERNLEVASPDSKEEVLPRLLRACEERRVVEMEYYSYGRGELTRRRVHPLSMEFGMGHWYLHAWDTMSGEMRVFRVDRIKDLRVTEERFDPRPEAMAGGKGASAAPDSGELTVRLRFSPTLAPWAREQPLFTEFQEDGSGLVCTLRTGSLSWLEKELLRWGKEVEVLHPPELREGLRRRVESMLALYAKRRPGHGGSRV